MWVFGKGLAESNGWSVVAESRCCLRLDDTNCYALVFI
jgi:hypothetical protein